MANIQGFGIQLATGGFSLEANTIFATYAEALAYAQSSAAYVGKVISVTSGENKGIYSIEAVGADAAFKKVGSDVDLSNYVTKDQITNLYTYKGSKTTFDELPIVNEVGDTWNVEEAYDNHPAGTNWAWNGTEWDALAGSIDLSGYALKENVDNSIEEVNKTVASNTGAISSLQSALETKVDAVEGQSLITAEKLALIDTNASDIALLQSADTNFETRLQTIEGAFKGEGGEIDLGDITSQLSAQGGRITALETDNGVNKNAISNLQTRANGYDTRLTAIETLNTEQGTQLQSLTNRVIAVEAHGTAITNLTAAVNKNTEDIGKINSAIDGLAVKSVVEGEKILASDANGALSTTLGLESYKKDDKTYIKLTGINGAIVDEFDASEFIKDGMIDSVAYDPATKKMTITWNTSAGKDATVVDMSDLVDTYTAGSGLAVVNNEFSVKVNSDSKNKLTLVEGSLMVDISADVEAINESVDEKIEQAFAWIEVK